MATRNGADSTAPPMCVVALLKRERARALVRAAFPRRRAHVHAAKSAADVEEYLIKELVDVVIARQHLEFLDEGELLGRRAGRLAAGPRAGDFHRDGAQRTRPTGAVRAC